MESGRVISGTVGHGVLVLGPWVTGRVGMGWESDRVGWEGLVSTVVIALHYAVFILDLIGTSQCVQRSGFCSKQFPNNLEMRYQFVMHPKKNLPDRRQYVR